MDVPGGSAQAWPTRCPTPRLVTMQEPFSPGSTARVELVVTVADTAQAIGSGDVPVLGTPRILALAEAATVAAIARQLPSGATTVGVRVELDHQAATPVGRTVVARARLAEVDGRRLLFAVSVTEDGSTVAEGRVERLLVDRQRFIERAGRSS
ncbi:Thioesterase superfamily [Salinispora tropica CNB-440]|uniref:Thioesterase superfamily n=2 Tax=Salinispora tropica TaxID=168695 RepID=A4X9A9_SALTO|nr:Thioesterase superfamily [Salinispora tropica CNB-440]